MERAVVLVDGSCRGNPGPVSVGWIIGQGGEILERGGRKFGIGTNNTAEYLAIITALERCIELGLKEVTVKSDSQLAVMQITRGWKVNHKHLRDLRDKARHLMKFFDKVDIVFVPREMTEAAHDLATEETE